MAVDLIYNGVPLKIKSLRIEVKVSPANEPVTHFEWRIEPDDDSPEALKNSNG